MTIWTPPVGVKAIIIAELREDRSDVMTDYFASCTVKTVYIAYSKHTRNLFAEMRKAASKFEPTRFLATEPFAVKGTVEYNPQHYLHQKEWEEFSQQGKCGAIAEFHRDLFPIFRTEEDRNAFLASVCPPIMAQPLNVSFEHRENYAMGGGYYLADGYYDGWQVKKTGAQHISEEEVEKAKREGNWLCDSPAPSKNSKPTGEQDSPFKRENPEKGGIEIVFPGKPSEDTLLALRQSPFRYHRAKRIWYAPNTEATRAIADQILVGN